MNNLICLSGKREWRREVGFSLRRSRKEIMLGGQMVWDIQQAEATESVVLSLLSLFTSLAVLGDRAARIWPTPSTERAREFNSTTLFASSTAAAKEKKKKRESKEKKATYRSSRSDHPPYNTTRLSLHHTPSFFLPKCIHYTYIRVHMLTFIPKIFPPHAYMG